MNLTVDQCRAARAMLGWTAKDLAQRSGVSVSTIRLFEMGRTVMMTANRKMLVEAFEAAGLQLIWEPKARLVGVIGPAKTHKRELVKDEG